jgi:hypothetical protein
MRTAGKEASHTQRSGQHLAFTNTLRVVLDPKGRVNLDADTTSYLLRCGIEAVRLLWNAEQRTMVFRPVKLTSDFSYPIVRDRKSQQLTFSAQRFFRRVGWRTKQAIVLPMKWKEHERLLEVALPLEPPSATRDSQQFFKKGAA